ncbi:MAG: hypothetical protein JWM66_869 [Solirubrobacterales bacterium]|nr:hypothetical protein [Solirubrobacterales bacterium]
MVYIAWPSFATSRIEAIAPGAHGYWWRLATVTF